MSTQTISPVTGRKHDAPEQKVRTRVAKSVAEVAENILAEATKAAKPEPKRPQSKRPSVQLGFVMSPELADRVRKASKKDGMSAWLRAACELKLAS